MEIDKSRHIKVVRRGSISYQVDDIGKLLTAFNSLEEEEDKGLAPWNPLSAFKSFLSNLRGPWDSSALSLDDEPLAPPRFHTHDPSTCERCASQVACPALPELDNIIEADEEEEEVEGYMGGRHTRTCAADVKQVPEQATEGRSCGEPSPSAAGDMPHVCLDVLAAKSDAFAATSSSSSYARTQYHRGAYACSWAVGPHFTAEVLRTRLYV